MKFSAFEQLISLYTKAPLAHKIAVPLLLIFGVGSIVFVSRWASRPSYHVLYSGLEEGDAAAVVEHLKDQKIKFDLRDGGRTIEVTPPEMVHELRLELAAVGIPRGGSTGFELFDEIPLGQTGFVEKIKRTRAIQGELERTIQSLDVIRKVRIHVTIPERSVFIKRDTPPTASVLLKLKAGARLTQEQVAGIAHLVANSVERLTVENVTIVDTKGNMLNEQNTEESLSGMDRSRIEYQSGIEQVYSKRVETMLSEILGPGRAVARVTAELDFSRFEKEEEAFDPGGQVIRSERQVDESMGLSAQGGVPGVISNLTNDPGVLTAPDSSKNANGRTERVTNYEVSRAVSRMVSSPGKITKLSVAVLVDGQYKQAASDAAGAPDAAAVPGKEYKPLTREMLHKIENLVKQAVGFDPTRGDVVTIENIRFYETDETMEEMFEKEALNDQIYNWVSLAVPVVLGIIFLLIVIKPLVQYLIRPTESEVDLSRLLPAGIGELEAEMDAERSKLSTTPIADMPSVDIEELEELLSENSRAVKENPQQAALLIRYWLNEGRA